MKIRQSTLALLAALALAAPAQAQTYMARKRITQLPVTPVISYTLSWTSWSGEGACSGGTRLERRYATCRRSSDSASVSTSTYCGVPSSETRTGACTPTTCSAPSATNYNFGATQTDATVASIAAAINLCQSYMAIGCNITNLGNGTYRAEGLRSLGTTMSRGANYSFASCS